MSEQAPKPGDGTGDGSGDGSGGGPTITDQEMASMRKVIRTVALVVLGVFSVGVLVFYLGWVRAPTPEQVCKHKIALVHETVGQEQADGAEALVGQLEANCVVSANRKIQLRGKLVWAEYAKCVTSATTLAEAERC